MTIKEYADTRQVTYEAVRQLVKKLDAELNGHITKHGRTRVLDDDAVKMLDDRRTGTRLAVIKAKATEQADTVDQLKNEIILLQRQLLTAQDEHKQLALEHAQSVARLEAVSDTNKRMQDEIDRLQSELGQYHKSVFGFYRKGKK